MAYFQVGEADYPKRYRSVIRRLQQAIAEPELKKTMKVEDEVLEDLQNLERMVEKKDKTIEAKDKTIEEKDKALAEREHLIAELTKRLG